MKKNVYLKLFVASLPVLVIASIYLVTDPFKVIYHHDTFLSNNNKQYIILNKDYTTTETFVKNCNKYQYDSYIFGSSLSRCYQVSEWKKYVSGNSFFHFDAYKESLFGIERKLNFVHSKGLKVKNALILFDALLLAQTENQTGHIFRKHPLISGESGLDFQMTNFKDFLDVSFLSTYIKFIATGQISPDAVRNGYMDTTSIDYDDQTNEVSFDRIEQKINAKPEEYYNKMKERFYSRTPAQEFDPPVIQGKQKLLLYSIKKILDEDSTNYRIVINPLYNQKKLNGKDVAFLENLFGKTKVFDFSGKNSFTENIGNYYEEVHYRRGVAIQILDSIYR